MKSWLGDLPEGASVQVRQVHEGVVQVVWGGRREAMFEATIGGALCCLSSVLASDADRDLLVKGARFWLVYERVTRPDGTEFDQWRVRFARPGVESARAAFGVPDGEP